MKSQNRIYLNQTDDVGNENVTIYIDTANKIYESYNDKGNIIYSKEYNPDEDEYIETWWEYNDIGDVVHVRSSDGGEQFITYKYTTEGYIEYHSISICGKVNDDMSFISEYNVFDKITHFKSTDGEESWWEYNNDKLVYKKTIGVDGSMTEITFDMFETPISITYNRFIPGDNNDKDAPNIIIQ